MNSRMALWHCRGGVMNSRILVIHPEKCNGCGDCEVACSIKGSGINSPDRSSIHVINENHDDTFFLPVTCHQCEDPPCLDSCPNEAIYRDNVLDRTRVNPGKCVGCRMCVSACPFGAMGFDEERGKSFKCELCEGEPECVRVCKEKAIEYTDPYMLQRPQMHYSAARLAGVMHL